MSFDVESFASHLRTHAEGQSLDRRARYVRLALEAGGANAAGHPLGAKDWGPILTKNGFRSTAVPNPERFRFQKGDIQRRKSKAGIPIGQKPAGWRIGDFRYPGMSDVTLKQLLARKLPRNGN